MIFFPNPIRFPSCVSRTISSIEVCPMLMRLEPGFAEGPHAVLAAGVAELVERGLGDDHLAKRHRS